jgi:hypothetical protein
MSIRQLYGIGSAEEVHPPWHQGCSWLIPLGSAQSPRDPQQPLLDHHNTSLSSPLNGR